MSRVRSSQNRVEVIGDAVLHLADYRDVFSALNKVDAVVTDPPYGIGWGYKGFQDTKESWIALIDDLVPWARLHANKIAISVGSSLENEAYIYQKHQPLWRVCWYRGSTVARCPIGFRSWEMIFIWGKGFGNDDKLIDHFQTHPEQMQIDHPCPKPLAWSTWLVSRLSFFDQTILDPFMGSGTTGVACMRLGRKFIGIEIHEPYFDIACKRIEKEYRRGDFMRSDRGMLRTAQTALLPTAVARPRMRRTTK